MDLNNVLETKSPAKNTFLYLGSKYPALHKCLSEPAYGA